MTSTHKHLAGAGLVTAAFLALHALSEIPLHGAPGILVGGLLAFGAGCSLFAGSAFLCAGDRSAERPVDRRR